eukprot:403362297
METLFKDSQISKGFLVGEYLTQDLTSYASSKNTEQITLQNLREIQKNPYQNMQNLTISDQMEKLAHDMNFVSDKIGYILDLSTRFNGLEQDKIKRLQELSQNKIQILFGYSPNQNYIAKMLSIDNIEDHLKNDIEFEMKTGRKKMLPSFIGELIISNLEDIFQRTLIQQSYNFQKIYGCPIFVNIGQDLNKLEVLNEVFQETKGQSIIYVIHSFMQNDLEGDQRIIKLLQNSKSMILIKLYDHNLSHYNQQGFSYRNTSSFQLRLFLNQLIQLGMIERVLLSNGVQFKTHLSFYGGRGYKALQEKVLNHFDLAVQDQILIHNPARLMLWREQIQEAPALPTPKWDCRLCKGKFEETHQKFEKMENNYCSMKCLSTHRQQGFN